MIDRQFWEDVRSAWITDAPPRINKVLTGSEGKIAPGFLEDPWSDEIPFEDIDYEKTFESMLHGGDVAFKDDQSSTRQTAAPEPAPMEILRPELDAEAFEQYMDKKTIPDYVEAAKLLRACNLPEKMDELYKELIKRLLVLQDAVTKFAGVYQADLESFYEYYVPEALQLTSIYLEYLGVGIEEKILQETEKEVLDAVKKLLLAVNDTIDEIYKFASMEIKAKAKALESLMSQDGHVDSDFKIN